MNINLVKKDKNKKFIVIVMIVIIITLLVLGTIYVKKSFNETNELELTTQYEFFKDILIDETVATADVRKVKNIDAAVPIFMYHFVRDDTGGYEYPENMIRPSTLEAQLKYLKENGYETIYKTDIGNLENFTKPVWLTFDDGWEDFYIYGYPLFKKYNMKASYYVITDLIGTPGYVKLDQLKEMKESGLIDIQSHTVTHPRLATLNKDKIYQELSISKQYLKENLDIDSEVICYPYGSFNNTVFGLSKEIGYKYGLAMDGGVYYTNRHKETYAIPRIYANRSMSLETFENYVKKSYVDVEWE